MEDREMNGSKTGSNEAKSSKLILAADHKNDAIKTSRGRSLEKAGMIKTTR
jgi:hypothetical protein